MYPVLPVLPLRVLISSMVCGLAQLHLNGVLDKNGRMGEHARARTYEGQREFILISEQERNGAPAISITQRDVRQLQLAKGAIRTGIQALLQETGHSEEEIEQVIIAGAFGNYIDISSAITIGMLPSLSLNRFRQVGNAAGTGARLALVSRNKRAEAQKIARKVHYIELANLPNFQELFVQAMYLGPFKLTQDQKEGMDR
ncbi:hypothetical protein ES705_33709 [subsurface metagenome]